MKKRVLITGGAGYIGSHVVKELNNHNFDIIVIDDLSNGYLENLVNTEYVKGDFADSDCLRRAFLKPVDGVIHLAASTNVSESVSNPVEYYENNVSKTLKLLKFIQNHGKTSLVFSSTAAVYGDKHSEKPVTEEASLNPMSPYASSKLMSEMMIKDIKEINYSILRYFNVAGVCPSYKIGPRESGASHLIKACAETAVGKRENITIYGTDYPTKDGTGVRDFIHVQDLAVVHRLVLENLLSGGDSHVFNCGYSTNFSVREVINCMKKVSGVDFKVIEGDRRKGDIAQLSADSSLLRKTLNWQPKFDNLEKIVKTAYEWEKRNQ